MVLLHEEFEEGKERNNNSTRLGSARLVSFRSSPHRPDLSDQAHHPERGTIGSLFDSLIRERQTADRREKQEKKHGDSEAQPDRQGRSEGNENKLYNSSTNCGAVTLYIELQ